VTLRRAVRLFVRAWTPHPVATFEEWLLAAAVIEDAIARDEQDRVKAARPALGPQE
jgi:hypothetical protein